ncbi:histidine triad nucleotide-binding protein [Atopobiaceae bacterium 24-176]
MDDCVFCKIASGEIPADVVYEDDLVVAFKDLAPQAPVHVLVIPKAHYASVADGVPAETLKAMFDAVAKVAEATGVAGSGFRCIANTGADAGQTVGHAHVHVLGGAPLGEELLVCEKES